MEEEGARERERERERGIEKKIGLIWLERQGEIIEMIKCCESIVN